MKELMYSPLASGSHWLPELIDFPSHSPIFKMGKSLSEGSVAISVDTLRPEADWRSLSTRMDYTHPRAGESEIERMFTTARSAEIQRIAGERLELVSLKYNNQGTPEVLDRLHSLTQRLTKLMPPVKDEAVSALEELSNKLEAFSKNIDRLGALIEK